MNKYIIVCGFVPSAIIAMLWFIKYLESPKKYAEEFREIHECDIWIDFIKFLVCAFVAYLAYKYYSVANNPVGAEVALHMIAGLAFSVTSMEATTCGLNSLGIWIFRWFL